MTDLIQEEILDEIGDHFCDHEILTRDEYKKICETARKIIQDALNDM